MTQADRVLLMVIVAIAGAVRLWGISFGLPHSETRPDERQLINLAIRIASGDSNPHYFIWPSAQMYALAALFRGGSWLSASINGVELSRPDLHLIARLFSAALGTASVGLIWIIARRFELHRLASAAALFLALAYLHVRDSHFGTLDVPMTFAVLAAFVLLPMPESNVRRLALYGLVAGLATSVKYNAAVLALPAIWLVIRDALILRQNGLRPLAHLAAVALAFVGGFLIGTPYAVLDPDAFVAGLTALRRHIADGHVHGGQVLAVPDAGRYYLSVVLPAAVGWPLFTAGMTGLALLVIRRPREGIATVIVPLVSLTIAATGQTAFARYVIPVIPFLCLGAAEVVSAAAARLNAGGLMRQVVTLVLPLALIFPSAWTVVWLDLLLARRDNRLVATEWIEKNIPAGASIAQTGSIYGRLQLPVGRYAEWSWDERAEQFVREGRPQEAGPDVLVVQNSPLTLYSPVPASLKSVVRSSYLLVQSLRTGIAAVPEQYFDPADAFYVPLVRVDGIRRPGPDVLVYRRRE
ncbi:MAG TPA: glycosyltransferase family 39 protein [Vicinamibacterales bacterium]|nr:glycosyltransferase family 39 protein [Vicinamibacterales bacterium]